MADPIWSEQQKLAWPNPTPIFDPDPSLYQPNHSCNSLRDNSWDLLLLFYPLSFCTILPNTQIFSLATLILPSYTPSFPHPYTLGSSHFLLLVGHFLTFPTMVQQTNPLNLTSTPHDKTTLSSSTPSLFCCNPQQFPAFHTLPHHIHIPISDSTFLPHP